MNSRVGRQLAVEQQIADREEVGVLGKLVDRIAAIEQLALVAVDVGDRALAVRGRGEAGIVREATRVFIEIGDVDDVRANRAGSHRELDLLVVDGQRRAGLGRAGDLTACCREYS